MPRSWSTFAWREHHSASYRVRLGRQARLSAGLSSQPHGCVRMGVRMGMGVPVEGMADQDVCVGLELTRV